jgi:sulfatase-like protein
MLPGPARASHLELTALPWHSLLAAAFPVLFLFAENSADQVTLRPLWVPLGVAIAGAAIGVVVGRLATGDWYRGGLMATLALALFFSFGHVWFAVEEMLIARRWLIGAYLLIALVGGWLIWRGGAWVRPASRFLNVALTALVAVNALSIANSTLSATASVPDQSSQPVTVTAEGHRRPDVYYLIMDRYANARSLADIYDYDNSRFLDALRERGFYVAQDAWANYLKTALSVTSSLSMDFLDGPALAAQAQVGHELAPINALLGARHAGPTLFQQLGYEYVHIGNWWQPSIQNAGADVSIAYGEGVEFSAALGETTALSLLSPQAAEQKEPTVYTPSLVRRIHEFEFAQVRALPQRSGPTFAFAHFLLPHPPYVYAADGSPPEPGIPEDERYVQQVEYTNGRLLETIDALLDVPAGEEPVIVIQADEGPFPPEFDEDQRDFQWLNADADQIQRKFGILNALYLPGVDPASVGLNQRSSPVNALRYVLNAYFDAGLPLLPDTTYLSPDYPRIYDFVEVHRSEDGTPILPAQ